jgi:hypothetical protein
VVGAVLLLVFIAGYALLAMAAAAAILPRSERGLEFLYYLTTGLLWVLPAGLIIRWMQRPGG